MFINQTYPYPPYSKAEKKNDRMKDYLERNDRAQLYELLVQGLTIEGEQHKQWYLQRIAEVLEIDVSEFDVEEGIAP